MDLLHENAPAGLATPRAADEKRLSERLTFGFARGTDEADLVNLLGPELGGINVRPDCFEGDLFIDELLDGCFAVVAQGKRWDGARAGLRRLLTSPPARPTDAVFRQGILAELLEDAELTAALEAAYVALRSLRQTLCAQDRVSAASHVIRRRIEILMALRRAVVSLEPLGRGRSGLGRLGAFASTLRETPAFARLEQLLAFEDQRTVLETQLSLGYDGTLRRFDIVRATESSEQGFARGAGSRFFRRLLGFLRGHRFSEDDVMSQLLERVFVALEPDLIEMLRVTSALEFYLASLAFRRLAERNGLGTCLPSFDAETRELGRLFNPWLLAAAQAGSPPVPCDLTASPARGAVIVTGPNSGGKTRFLQAIAVAQLLGQAGSFVPAERAQLVWVDQLFLSLIERPGAEQKEGRLGTELLRIRKVFETSGAASLILMDELCSGTNPSEGEEIFQMVLELFAELGPQVFISTHFLDFAERLQAAPHQGLSFLQVELSERDRPTYQFIPGVATTSLAQTTAARLGVTRDELSRLVEERRAAAKIGS